MENVAFIINPASAKGNYQNLVKELNLKLSNPKIHLSESIEGTHLFIEKEMDTTSVFVAVGGDGTIASVAAKLINTSKILGVYPAGSGNGFSNETGFSSDVDTLISKIKKQKIQTIDTFTVNGNLSINVSGVGFDGEVAKEFEKTSRGFANYIKVSVQTFFKYKPIKINFKNSEFQKYDGEYMMASFANTRQFGNNAYIAPQARFSDGLIEVVLVKKFPFYYGGIFAVRMFKGSLKADQYVRFLSVPELEFETNSEHWHLDGESRLIKSPVKVKIQPQCLHLLV